jgi:hypothetical protein
MLSTHFKYAAPDLEAMIPSPIYRAYSSRGPLVERNTGEILKVRCSMLDGRTDVMLRLF